MPLILENGGKYSADLTRSVTHLIVKSSESKKYHAAKSWHISTVTIEWLEQTIQRGMVLDEKCFDPTLPASEIGKGSWTRKEIGPSLLGKRSRSGNPDGGNTGLRKLRKSASSRLGSHGAAIWEDILGRKSNEASTAVLHGPVPSEPSKLPTPKPVEQLEQNPDLQGIFTRCLFLILGFKKKRADILQQTISSLGGHSCEVITDEIISTSDVPLQFLHQFVIVPQDASPATYLDKVLNAKLPVVTEFFIERCMQNHTLFSVDEHVLGQPFSLFPIPGFDELVICTAGFTNIELNHVEKTVTQLGAKYRETFKQTTSLLVCKSPATIRKEKLSLALRWNVPVVSEDWLWQCISTGSNVAFEPYVLPPDFHPYTFLPKPQQVNEERQREGQRVIRRVQSDPVPSKAKNQEPPATALSTEVALAPRTDAALNTENQAPGCALRQLKSDGSTTFVTAKTHQEEADSAQSPIPKGTSTRALNKAPTSRSHTEPTARQFQTNNDPCRNTPNNDASNMRSDRGEQRLLQRRALSSQLASLIHPAAASSTTSFEVGPETESAYPRPRKKHILGRATSNVSAASSVSAGDAAAHLSGGSAARDVPGPPPSTQIEYRDSAAEVHREAVIKRMMMGTTDVVGQM